MLKFNAKLHNLGSFKLFFFKSIKFEFAFILTYSSTILQFYKLGC